jgi:hypothetical protein
MNNTLFIGQLKLNPSFTDAEPGQNALQHLLARAAASPQPLQAVQPPPELVTRYGPVPGLHLCLRPFQALVHQPKRPQQPLPASGALPPLCRLVRHSLQQFWQALPCHCADPQPT